MSLLKLLKVELLASPGDFEARQIILRRKKQKGNISESCEQNRGFFTVVGSICCCHLRLGWIYTHKRCEKAFEDPVAVSLKACRMYNRIPVRIRSERCVHAEVVARDIKPRLFISQNWSFEARLKGLRGVWIPRVPRVARGVSPSDRSSYQRSTDTLQVMKRFTLALASVKIFLHKISAAVRSGLNDIMTFWYDMATNAPAL